MGAALPWIAIAASAAGSVMQAQGAQQQGQANAQALNYQAAVARNNQLIANQYAQMETQRGEVMAQQKEQQTAQRMSTVRAAAGAAGLDTGGTPARLEEDTRAMGELDARTIRYNAARSAYGYRTQGMSYAAQAGLDTMASADALRGGNLGASAAIISGGASVSDKWLQYKQWGVT